MTSPGRSVRAGGGGFEPYWALMKPTRNWRAGYSESASGTQIRERGEGASYEVVGEELVGKTADLVDVAVVALAQAEEGVAQGLDGEDVVRLPDTAVLGDQTVQVDPETLNIRRNKLVMSFFFMLCIQGGGGGERKGGYARVCSRTMERLNSLEMEGERRAMLSCALMMLATRWVKVRCWWAERYVSGLKRESWPGPWP